MIPAARSRLGPPLVALSFGLALLLRSADVEAFCRSRSCVEQVSLLTGGRFPCAWDEHTGCLIAGPKLHWGSNCLSFSVQQDGSTASNLDLDTARAVFEAAFETWRGADCGDGVTPSFSVVNLGDVQCQRAEYNQHQPNANILMFLDDAWPYPGGDTELALTTVTYDYETGKIVDADIEFNSRQFTFTTTDDPGLVLADLAGIATHEIGHFLGLSHSPVGGTTMASHVLGSPLGMRTLEPDDVAGICAIYPPGEALSTSCPVSRGFSGSCAVPEAKETGCAVSGRRGRVALAYGLLLLGFVVAIRRRSAPAR